MRYPTTWQKRSSLTALPGHFCVSRQVRIADAVLCYFQRGHPLHILSRRVRLVCESAKHTALCPNDLECVFDDEDMKRVFKAIFKDGARGEHIDNEVRRWAYRMLHQNPDALARLVNDLPQIRRAVADVVQNTQSTFELHKKGIPINVSFALIRSGHLSLDVVDKSFIAMSQKLPGNDNKCPNLSHVVAFASLETWVLYLNERVSFNQLCDVCRLKIKLLVASLCYPDYSSLPPLPVEMARLICVYLDR